jgi:hypothetical protein
MKSVFSILCCLSFAIAAQAQDSAVVFKPLSISTGIEAGEVVDGYDEYYRENLAKDHWQARLGVWLNQEVTLNKRLTIKMGTGGLFYNPYPEEKELADDYVVKFGPGISQATGILSFGGEDIANPWFQLQFGYFPFKYNSEAANLGEYLLRSGCYPGTLEGGNWSIIGDPVYRVLGTRFSSYLFNKSLQQHFIISSERDVPPIYDLSLTYIADYNLLKIIDIGAGVDFHHLISANENKTTPKKPENRYADGVPLNKNVPDSLYSKVEYYTFRGVKLMGKMSIDPKPLFKTSIFGKEDLKIFGEFAVLGVQNYPYYYDDIKKRIPVMFGFNFPCFKLLDVLSFQWEWYGSNFENSTYNPYNRQIPLPKNDWEAAEPLAYLDSNSAYVTEMNKSNPSFSGNWKTLRDYYGTDNWKWSIYMKRTLSKNFALFLQMADDNMRLKTATGRSNFLPTTRGNQYWYQMFQNHWYLMLRLTYGI